MEKRRTQSRAIRRLTERKVVGRGRLRRARSDSTDTDASAYASLYALTRSARLRMRQENGRRNRTLALLASATTIIALILLGGLGLFGSQAQESILAPQQAFMNLDSYLMRNVDTPSSHEWNDPDGPTPPLTTEQSESLDSTEWSTSASTGASEAATRPNRSAFLDSLATFSTSSDSEALSLDALSALPTSPLDTLPLPFAPFVSAWSLPTNKTDVGITALSSLPDMPAVALLDPAHTISIVDVTGQRLNRFGINSLYADGAPLLVTISPASPEAETLEHIEQVIENAQVDNATPFAHFNTAFLINYPSPVPVDFTASESATVTVDIAIPAHISIKASRIFLVAYDHEEVSPLEDMAIVDNLLDVPGESEISAARFSLNVAEPTQSFAVFFETDEPLDAYEVFGPEQPNAPYLRASRGTIAPTPLAVTVVSPDKDETDWQYQWYRSNTPLSPYREQGAPISDARATEHYPLIDTVGITYYYCEIWDADDPTRVMYSDVVPVAVSTQQVFDIGCESCHFADVRKQHEQTMTSGGTETSCQVCHAQPYANWSIMQPGIFSAAQQRDATTERWQQTCGTDNDACHGLQADDTDTHARSWHGLAENTERLIDAHAPLRYNSKGQIAPTRGGSCSGEGNGCHSMMSTESQFYFGGMDFMTAHNDYYRALQSKETTTTPLLGARKLTPANASAHTNGCVVCHYEVGVAPHGADLRQRALQDNVPFDCTSCHTGESYFAQSNDPHLANCQRVAGLPNYDAPRIGTPGVTSRNANTHRAAIEEDSLITSLSKHVISLVGDLLGLDEPEGVVLEGSTIKPLPEGLPPNLFPIATIISGNGPPF